jgi:hypothetical protein
MASAPSNDLPDRSGDFRAINALRDRRKTEPTGDAL